MTSTAGLDHGDRKPNYARRIKWLGIVTAVLMLAFTGGWLYLASVGETQIDLALAKVNTGTPIHTAWQDVVPPEKGNVSRIMST